MNEIKKEQLKAIIISSVALVLGILFIVLKDEMIGMLQTIACFTLLVFGIIQIMVYCFLNTENKDYSKLIIGAVSTLLAVLLIFVNILFVIILGIIVAISGIVFIKSAIDDKKSGDKQWWITLAVGILFLILGISVAILYNIDVLKSIIMIIFGITLIIEGIMGFVFVFILHKVIRLNFLKKDTEESKEDEFVKENNEIEGKEEKSQKSIENAQKNEEKLAKIKESVKKMQERYELSVEDDETDEGGFI